MFRKIICYLFFCLIPIFGYSKNIIIVDQEDLTPVSFAHILTENGELLFSSNMDGVFRFDEDSTINKNTLLKIKCFSHQENTFIYQNLIDQDTLFLHAKATQLNEVTVKAKKSTDYLVLKGYFRSIQYCEHVPHYYLDGIVEYYISDEGYGKKMKFRVLQRREFKNDEIIKKENKRKSPRMCFAHVPMIPTEKDKDDKNIGSTLSFMVTSLDYRKNGF